MSITVTKVETPWMTADGRPKLQVEQTDTYDDGSFTVSLVNEMPPGATVITQDQYQAEIAILIGDQLAGQSGTAFDFQQVADQQAAGRAALAATIIPKLMALGFTAQEAEGIFPT